MTNLKTVTDKASEIEADAKETVDELAEATARKLDEARASSGGALHSAASSVRAAGRMGSDTIGNLSTGAADRLDATGSYVEDRELKGMFADLRRFGRRHLTASMLAAIAVGFFAASAINKTAPRRRWR